jgi:hypothetical protein
MHFIERVIFGFIDLKDHTRKQGMRLHVVDIGIDLFCRSRDRPIDAFGRNVNTSS